MRFHWYWPFARHEELDWARYTLRPGEEMVVEVIDRSQAPPDGYSGGVLVVRDLPDVDRNVGRVGWVPSRASTYRRRAAARRHQWCRGDFDLVHLHYVNRFTDAFSKVPQPFVMSVHDVVPHAPRLGRHLEHGLLGRLYRRPDALVVHHPKLADDLMTHFGVPTNRIHLVPHQVFPVTDPQPSPPPGPPIILFFGALRQNKGLEVLGEAMGLLKGVDLRLSIVGRGDPAQERLAQHLAKTDERITAEIGFATLDRKRELFDLATAVVLPYTAFSSQSGVLHDAYGHGRPVVVTDVGALGLAVREDGTGEVVAPSDPAALARSIRGVLEPGNWSEFAAAARGVAADRTPLAVGARLREVYDHVLG